MLEFPRPKSSSRITQLERPQKVTRLLEIGSHSQNFMDQVLHAYNAVLAQILFDDLVVGEGDALLIDLPIAALIDEVADSFEGWVAVGDVGFDDFEHFQCSFCEADENTIVDLEEAEELEDFAGFWGDFVDTEGLALAVQTR